MAVVWEAQEGRAPACSVEEAWVYSCGLGGHSSTGNSCPNSGGGGIPLAPWHTQPQPHLPAAASMMAAAIGIIITHF